MRETQGISFTSQRKAEALKGKRYNYRRTFIQGGRGAHLLYLENFCATSFSKKSFKHGRDSLQSILKPLFAIFQDPHAVLVSGFTHIHSLRKQAVAKTSVSSRSSHRVHDFHNIAHSNINTSFDPLKFYNHSL